MFTLYCMKTAQSMHYMNTPAALWMDYVYTNRQLEQHLVFLDFYAQSKSHIQSSLVWTLMIIA